MHTKMLHTHIHIPTQILHTHKYYTIHTYIRSYYTHSCTNTHIQCPSQSIEKGHTKSILQIGNEVTTEKQNINT